MPPVPSLPNLSGAQRLVVSTGRFATCRGRNRLQTCGSPRLMEPGASSSRVSRSLANPEQQSKLAAVRARARRSSEWARARQVLGALCLCTGHLRPAAHEVARSFGQQGPVPTPGSSASPEVSEIHEVRAQIALAHTLEHPGFVCDPQLPQDTLRACEWLCEHRSEAISLRSGRLEQLRDVLSGLAHWSVEYRACASAHVAEYQEPHLHVAAIDCLAEDSCRQASMGRIPRLSDRVSRYEG